MQKQATVFLID